jgi:hypothetical protein
MSQHWVSSRNLGNDYHMPTCSCSSSFVLKSLPLTKWFLKRGANPNLGPHPHLPGSTDGPMIPNSGFTFNHAPSVDPSISINVIDLLLQYGARLEDGLPLHLQVECGPYIRSTQHEDDHNGDEVSSPASSVTLDYEDPEPPSSSPISVMKHLLSLACDRNADDGRMFGASSWSSFALCNILESSGKRSVLAREWSGSVGQRPSWTECLGG